MNEQENMKVVQDAYAAFGRDDIQSVLNALAENVDWQIVGLRDVLPYAGQHRGHEGVLHYFKMLSEALDIQQFEPKDFITHGDNVVVLGHEKGRARATVRIYEFDWAHIFILRNGKITRYRATILLLWLQLFAKMIIRGIIK